jgi:hypothetical protein
LGITGSWHTTGLAVDNFLEDFHRLNDWKGLRSSCGSNGTDGFSISEIKKTVMLERRAFGHAGLFLDWPPANRGCPSSNHPTNIKESTAASRVTALQIHHRLV